MTQVPQYFGARYPAIARRAVPALALWRARDGVLSPLTDGTPIAFSGSATFNLPLAKDAAGRLVRVAEQMPVVHMLDLDGDGVLEAPALQFNFNVTNYCLRSQDFTNWTATNSPAILSPTLTLGELVLSLLEDNSGNQEYYQSPNFVTGGALTARTCISIFVAKGNVNAAGGSGLVVRDTTASADRLVGTWTWATNAVGLDEPQLAASTGQVLGKEYYGRHMYRHQTTGVGVWVDVWRISFRTTTGFVPANNNVMRVFPAYTAAQQGNEFFGGAMASWEPQPYVITTTLAASTNTHQWEMTFEGAPQAATLAVQTIYSGTPSCIVSGSGTLIAVTNGSLVTPRLIITQVQGGYTAEMNDGTNPVVSASISITPTVGDKVLLRVALGADGSVTFGVSLNGGAETVATGSTPYGLPASWPSNPRIVLAQQTRGCERYLAYGVFAGAPSAQYLEEALR